MKKTPILLSIILFIITIVFLTVFIFTTPKAKTGKKSNISNNNYAYGYIYNDKENLNAAQKDFFKQYSFFDTTQNDREAEKILWQFIKKEAVEGLVSGSVNENSDDTTLFETTGAFRTNWAVEFDLDNDNEPEIIGVNDAETYCGSAYKCFYILKKYGDGYRNISYLLLNREFSGFKILKTESAGFYDILLEQKQYPDKKKVIRYNNF